MLPPLLTLSLVLTLILGIKDAIVGLSRKCAAMAAEAETKAEA